MRITIDVSAAVEIVMGGKRQQEIVNILNNADWVIAPSLFIYEASNTLWKYHEYQDYSKEDIMKKIEYLYKMVDQFIDAKDIFEEALPLSCKLCI
jgi:predicted nucleic acid-binding protein